MTVRDETGVEHDVFIFDSPTGRIEATPSEYYYNFMIAEDTDMMRETMESLKECINLRWSFSAEFHGFPDEEHLKHLHKLEALYRFFANNLGEDPTIYPEDFEEFNINNC